MKVQIRHAYSDFDPVDFVCTGPSLTHQEMRDECDVNVIMAKYAQTGVVTHLMDAEGQSLDVSGLGDYQHMLNTVIEAQEAFMGLDARVRKRFGNDPAALVEFLSDERNRDEAISLGLIDKPTQAALASQAAAAAPEGATPPPPAPTSTVASKA